MVHTRFESVSDQATGFTLTEAVVVCGIAGLLIALAVPQLVAYQETARALSAARHVAGRLQLARMEALKRSAHVALVFSQIGSEYSFAAHVDGNGNGVRSLDISDLSDPIVSASERLGDQFPGVAFGIIDGTPSIDGSGPLTGPDPVRVGRAGLVSFSPLGSATPGTIYVRGTDQRQYAIRITGATGRVRVLEFDVARRQWQPR